MQSQAYAFRPMTAADLPIVRQWLAKPHVAEWWGDPAWQFRLLSEDLAHPAMDQFIVECQRRAFAYLQCYDPDAWANHGFGALPRGARGIDQFIGEEDMIERGHGSAFIRAFANRFLALIARITYQVSQILFLLVSFLRLYLGEDQTTLHRLETQSETQARVNSTRRTPQVEEVIGRRKQTLAGEEGQSWQ